MSIEELRSRLKRYEGFLAKDPNNFSIVSDIIDLHIKLGDFDQARELITQALSKTPDDTSLKFRQATLALASGQVDEAILLLKHLLDSGVNAPAVRYNLAYSFLLAGRPAEAKDVLEALVNSPDSVPEAPVLLARALHHLGDVDKALAHAKTYISSHPHSAEALGVAAILSLDAGNVQEAKQWAEQAVQENADNLEGLVTLGSLALDTQDEAQARNYFSHAVTQHGRSGRAWSGMGLTDMLALDLPKAIDDLKLAVQYMPNHIGTWHALAWCQIVSDDLEGAKESFAKAMDIDHNFGETHGGMAVIAIMQKNFTEAELMIKRALRLDPKSFAARFAQSLMLANMGKPDSAQEMMQKILSSSIVEGGESLKDILVRTLPHHQNLKKRNANTDKKIH